MSRGEAAGPGPADPPGSEVLKAKYLDYCSAQVADLLLFLSPDEIYLISQRAAPEQGATGEASYTRMVQVATEWLSRKIRLPPFEVWVQDYLTHPDRYDEYLMGLWESELSGPQDDH